MSYDLLISYTTIERHASHSNHRVAALSLIIFSLGLFTVTQLNAQTNTFPTSGNVGIGTTSPNTLLDIYGNNNPVSFRILGGNNNSNSATINLGVVQGRDWELVAKKYVTSDGYALNINHKTDDYQGPVIFSWMNNEKVRIEPNGNFGIGTNNPTHKLDINTGGGHLKTYLYGIEHTVNTSGGWARGFRLRNEYDNKTAVFIDQKYLDLF